MLEHLLVDLALEEHAEHVDRPLRLGDQLLQPLQRALVEADQLVEARVQAVERVVVGRQHQHVVGHERLDPRQRGQPVVERIALRLGREHRDVRGDPRQHLVAGDEQLQLRAVQAGVLGRVARCRSPPAIRARRWSAPRRRPRGGSCRAARAAPCRSRRSGWRSCRAPPRPSRRRGRTPARRSGASRPVSAASSRHIRYSSRVIQSLQRNLRVIQPAMPMWSGCMWVTMTRTIGSPFSGPAKACAPGLGGLRPLHAGVDQRPAALVLQSPDVDEGQRAAERHAHPHHAGRDLHAAADLRPLGKGIAQLPSAAA